MSLYGDYSVKLDALKAWAKELDEDTVMSRLSKECFSRKDDTDSIYRGLLHRFKNAIADLNEEDDWRNTQQILNVALVPAVFMVSDNAIKVGNYYECLVTYADVATKKRLVKGFQYKNIGEINIYDIAGDVIGQIGLKSGLIWSCLFNMFIHKSEYSIEHTLPDHEDIISIQLYNVFGKTEGEIQHIIDEIIFKCSKEFNLNFQYCHLDPLIRVEGVQGHYDLKTTLGDSEDVPIMYFNNALGANDIRVKYLSFYQVIEYYFNRAQNMKLLEDIKAGNYTSESPINHVKLKSVLKGYVSSTKEIESLKLVLKHAVDVANFKAWVNEDPSRVMCYTNGNSTDKNINLSRPDGKIISRLAERVYSYRCAIAHSKGDIEEYVALPELSNSEIEKELQLVRYLAIKTIEKCSKW